MMKAWTIAFVIAATALTNAQVPVAIGLVRIDGHLLPIELISPRLFADPPFPTQTLVNGDALAPVPVPQELYRGLKWTLSDVRGKRVQLTTTEPVMVEMPYCGDRLMWRTTLKGTPPDPYTAPIPKMGMAVSGASIELPDDVASQPDESSRRVAQRIVALFLEKERARLKDEKGPYAAARAPGFPPVHIRQLLRRPIGDDTVYYFEAIKALKLSDGAISPDAGLVTGWIVDTPAGLRDHEVIYKINDDSYKENEHAQVHGIIRYEGKLLWLLEWRGWESESYVLHEWPGGNKRVTVSAYSDC